MPKENLFRLLYTNRERPPMLSRRWVKVWLKRTWHLPALLILAISKFTLKIRGAHIGDYSIVESASAPGRASNLTVGNRTFISRSALIGLHNQVQIGNNVVINAGARLITGSHDTDQTSWPLISARIQVDDFAWIAENAMILPGVHVGFGAVVGAGAVVRRDVAPLEIVIGNPATPIRERRAKTFNYSPIEQVAPYEAWLGPAK